MADSRIRSGIGVILRALLEEDVTLKSLDVRYAHLILVVVSQSRLLLHVLGFGSQSTFLPPISGSSASLHILLL